MVTGNTPSEYFPLVIGSFPGYAQYPNHLIPFEEGNNNWNSAKTLDFEVVILSPTQPPVPSPALFTSLQLLFLYDDVVYPQQELGTPSEYPEPTRKGTLVDRQSLNQFYNRLDDQNSSYATGLPNKYVYPY